MQAIDTLGSTIRAELARRGLPQTTLADHLGLSQAAVSRRLNGDVEFTASDLFKTADFLGLTVENLRGAA